MKSDNWKQRVGSHPHINEPTIMLGPFSSCEIISQISTFPGSFPNQSGIQKVLASFCCHPIKSVEIFIFTQQMSHLFFPSKNLSEILISTFHSRLFEKLGPWTCPTSSLPCPFRFFCWEGLKYATRSPPQQWAQEGDQSSHPAWQENLNSSPAFRSKTHGFFRKVSRVKTPVFVAIQRPPRYLFFSEVLGSGFFRLHAASKRATSTKFCQSQCHTTFRQCLPGKTAQPRNLRKFSE